MIEDRRSSIPQYLKEGIGPMTEDNVKTIGRYEIKREIGRGGMAIVYKAFDPHLNRPVAIKLIRVGGFTIDQLKTLPERFKREARALARLNHANIVQVYDFGTYGDMPYLVMEFLEGATLKEVRKPLKVETAVRLIRPIADALSYVHDQGMLHRDVKPSNIMITKGEKVVLTDFGIAKFLEESEDQNTLTGTGVGIGTPEYMAPEQGLGKRIDGRADIYSLAVVFYELITGRKPFQGETPLEVLTKQATEPFPDPREFVPDLPGSVRKFFDLALAKKPDDRYGSMKDFLRDLDGLRLQALTAAARKAQSGETTGIQTVPKAEAGTESSVRFGKTDIRKIRAGVAKAESATGSREIRSEAKALPIAQAVGTSGAHQAPQENSGMQRAGQAALRLMAVLAGLGILSVLFGLLMGRPEPSGFETSTTAPAETAEAQSRQTEIAGSRSMTETLGVEAAAVEADRAAQQATAEALWQQEATLAAAAAQMALTAELAAQTRQTEMAGSRSITETLGAEAAAVEADRAAQQATAEALWQKAEELAWVVAGMTATAQWAETAVSGPEPTSEPDLSFPGLKVGDIVQFGRYEQDNDLENGPEPIEWRVLEIKDQAALLLSRSILDLKSYHYRDTETSWMNCTLRKWLNEDFVEAAFMPAEAERIKIYNSFDRRLDKGYVPNKVFALTMEEVQAYIPGKQDRIAPVSDYVRGLPGYNAQSGNWWLRNYHKWSWDKTARVTTIEPLITIDPRGEIIGVFITNPAGVRPAIQIRLGDGD